MSDEVFIERRIVTGLVISTNYLQRVRKFWNGELLASPELRRVATWCWEYFEKYHKAPDVDIEAIFFHHKESNQLSKDEAEIISNILSRIADDFGRDEQFSASYLYDQTIRYFSRRELEIHTETVQMLIEQERIEEATQLQRDFRFSSFELSGGVELGSALSYQMIDEIFNTPTQRVLHYPGAFGEMLNEHLVRSGFVAFLAPEKRGKTWILIDAALRAMEFDKSNVAFFAAGDMTEKQLLKRISIYLTRQNDQEKYCKEHWRPVGDCVLNQIDQCTRAERNSDCGIYDETLQSWKAEIEKRESFESLVALAETSKDYRPCDARACRARQGTVWLVKEKERPVLTADRAKKAIPKFLEKHRRKLRIKSYDTGTLTSGEIRNQLDAWEKEDGFVPDLLIVDYADIMDGSEKDYRHRQNEIWMGLRGLSLNRDCLVLTATQADAESYKQARLTLSNFSNDKRKYAHVTAMWALNQDPKGREKKLGMLRIGELLVREGEFDPQSEVVVLQDLWIGRPFLGSFRR